MEVVSMPGPGSFLREIHRIRRHAKDLASKIEQAPRQLKAQQNQLARLEENLNQAKDAIKHAKVKQNEKEVTIRGLQTTIKKHEKQRDEAGNKKEYDALQLEIKQEKQNISKLEDEILGLMGEIEEMTAKLPALKKTLQQGKIDFVKYQADQEERLQRFAVDREQALLALAKVEADLPSDIQPFYELEVQRRRGCHGRRRKPHLHLLLHGNHREMYNDLVRESYVKCKSCGRILYLPDAG